MAAAAIMAAAVITAVAAITAVPAITAVVITTVAAIIVATSIMATSIVAMSTIGAGTTAVAVGITVIGTPAAAGTGAAIGTLMASAHAGGSRLPAGSGFAIEAVLKAAGALPAAFSAFFWQRASASAGALCLIPVVFAGVVAKLAQSLPQGNAMLGAG